MGLANGGSGFCADLDGTTSNWRNILQPKTRGRVARHQSARIDPTDVIRLLTAVYKNSNRDSRLWNLSSTTLRRRLNRLLKALGLPTERSSGVTPFDLGSFRPGGATFLLQMFEDAEFVRRRGRWVSAKVLEFIFKESALLLSSPESARLQNAGSKEPLQAFL